MARHDDEDVDDDRDNDDEDNDDNDDDNNSNNNDHSSRALLKFSETNPTIPRWNSLENSANSKDWILGRRIYLVAF